jgi:hypothetical protein
MFFLRGLCEASRREGNVQDFWRDFFAEAPLGVAKTRRSRFFWAPSVGRCKGGDAHDYLLPALLNLYRGGNAHDFLQSLVWGATGEDMLPTHSRLCPDRRKGGHAQDFSDRLFWITAAK